MYDEDCWKGYKQVGMKKGRNGNQVPNCVKEEELDEMSNSQLLGRLASKTVKKGKYTKVAKKALELKAKDSKNRGNEYYAAEVIRKFNVSGINSRALADVMSGMKEDTNPVKQARIDIEREVENDKKRHDRILDRARLARARQKNKETK